MNKKPERINLIKANEDYLKKKYGYNEIYLYSSNFLEEYIEKIVETFPDNQQQLRDNMSTITTFVLGDRLKSGLSRLCCAGDAIHMDVSFVDITADSFSIKEGHEYLETIFIHELLHAAARRNQGNEKRLTGVVEFIKDENNNAVGRKNIGLNEGITQFLAEKISKQVVPDAIDSYPFNKKVVSLLSDVLGSNTIVNSYFNHTDDLKIMMNSLANDPNYYEEFNKKLDTINRLETTVRRIKRGVIKPQDPDSLTRMEAVVTAQKNALMEGVFAKVVLPQIQKLETKEERQAKLLPLLSEHEEVLKPVAKYISKHPHSDWVADQIINAIQKEITENGTNFDKISQSAQGINEVLKIGPKVAKDFISAVDSFYNENEEAITTDHSTELTPLLKRELERMVVVLDQFEQLEQTESIKASLANYKAFLEKYFHKIPNLDEEIAKIRQAKKNPLQEEAQSKLPIDVQTIMDALKKQGQKQAVEDVHKPSNQPEETQVEEKTPQKFNLNDEFIINNITGAVINQHNTSLYQRVKNITEATGEYEFETATELIEMSQQASIRYIKSTSGTLSSNQTSALKKVYGENWQEVLRQAYEEGYQAGMKAALANAQKEGLEARKDLAEKVKNGEIPTEKQEQPITLEEVKFVYENFDIKTNEESGIVVVNKATSQPVLSERTKKISAFADEWVKATGSNAFTPAQAEVYKFLQTKAGSDLAITGTLDLDKTMVDAEIMGEKFKTTITNLFGTNQASSIVENYFRMQTPNAKVKPIDQPIATPIEERSSHK